MSAEVVLAPDAYVGLQLLRRDGNFELAVATLSWSDMSALTWARWSRSEGFTTPLVLLAAYADAELRATVRTLDGVTLVDRYVTEAELVRHLEGIRARATLERETAPATSGSRPELPLKIVVHERRRREPSQSESTAPATRHTPPPSEVTRRPA